MALNEPETAIESFDQWVTGDTENFIKDIIAKGRTPETELILGTYGLSDRDIDEVFQPTEPLLPPSPPYPPEKEPTTIDLSQENLGKAWGKIKTGDFGWYDFDLGLGALGVAGAYLETYVGRPWETAILEARARFQKAVGWGSEIDDIALQRLEQAREEYGWAGALVAEDVSDIWQEYSRKTQGPAGVALNISEWLNPAFFIPIGGLFGLGAKFTTKIPLLGKVLKFTAGGVQATRRATTLRAAEGITKLGAKGAEAVGKRIGEAAANSLIKKTEKLLLEIPETDRLLNGVLVDNWQRKALQVIAKIPPAKVGIEKALGWRILLKTESKAVEDIVGRAGVAHAEISRMGINAKAIKYWELQDISRNPTKLFGFDKNGYSARLKGNLEEIFTKPESFKLSETQMNYVTRFNETNTEILNLLKKEGVPPEHLVDDWVHRVVLTEGQKRGISRRIGARPSYEKTRKFETMADGINYFMSHPELKAYYANNPELLMSDYIQGAFKKIADERFINYIAKEMEAAGKTFGVRPTEKLIQFPELFEEITGKAGRELAEKAVLRTEELSAAKQFTDVMNRALRGETPHSATLAMLERKFPELGKRFRAVVEGKKVPPVTPEVTLPPSFIKATEDDILQLEKKIVQQRLTVLEARKNLNQIVPPEAKIEVVKPGTKELDALMDLEKITPAIVDATKTLRDELQLWKQLDDNLTGLKKFLAEAKAYKVAIPEAEVVLSRKEALTTIKKEVAELTEARKLPFWEAKTERAFRMEQLRQPTLKEGYIMEPFAGGKLYDREFIDAFNKFFGHEAGLPGLEVVSDVAGILRITKAALDLSFQAIQGLPSWGLAHAYMLKDPVAGARLMGAWYKTWAQSTVSFFRPEVLARAIAKEKDIAMQLVQFGGSARSIDYFQVLSARKGLAGAFEKVSQKIPFTPYQRAETAFFGGGQLVRNRFAEILMPKALKNGKEFELARFLDRITGLTDSASLGVPLTVRQLEQSFGWFAPNYTRACLTVLGDIFRGGYTGALTREALGGMVAAGSAMYSGVQYAVASLEGKSDEEAWRTVQEGFGVVTDPITKDVTWQPTGRFMTIKVGNYNMGFGGFWYGLLRLTGNIMACVNEVGDKEPIDLVRIMKHGTLNKQDNPFIYWWFTRSAPTFGMGYELASGKDFLGYPIETGADYAKYIATRFEPIWMEQGLNWMIPGMARDNEIPEGLARQALIPAEVFGMRTFPESQWVNFYDEANELIKHIPQDELDPKQIDAWREGTLTWKQLTDIQRINLLSRYPGFEELYNKAQTDSAVRGSENWKQWQGRVDEEKTTYYTRGDDLVTRLLDKDIDTREFREFWSEAGQNYGVSLDSIEKEPAYQEIYDYFEDKEAKGEKYGFMDDVALQEYINIVFADYLDENGDIDWDEKDKAVSEFIDNFGQDTYDRIRQFYDDKKRLEGLNPVLIKMVDDKDKLGRAYWNLPYRPYSEMDEDDVYEGNLPLEHLEEWKEYRALQTDEERREYTEANPEFGRDWRAEWRNDNPEDDARLSLWGYSGKLQSMEAYDLVAEWANELGIPLEQIGLGLPPRNIAPTYFEHNDIVMDTSPNSVQSKLYKLTTGKELLKWNLEQGIWNDDLSGESVEALTLRDQYKDLISERELWANKSSENYIDPKETINVDGKEVNKRQWTYDDQLKRNPEFRDAMKKVEVYQLSKSNPEAFTVEPEVIIKEYLPYTAIVDEHGAASSAAKLYRYKSQYLNKFGLQAKTFTEDGWEELDDDKVPIWEIDVKYSKEDEAYQAILDKYEDDVEQADATKKYLYPGEYTYEYGDIFTVKTRYGQPSEYAIARMRRQAFEKEIPEKHIETYITWYTKPELKRPEGLEDKIPWYEDDWFLQDNKRFYDTMRVIEGWKRRKFDKLPSRNVYAKYVDYLDLPKGKRREDYRYENQDLDAWLLLTGKTTKPIAEIYRERELTPQEKAGESISETQQDFERRLKELQESLGK